MLFWFRVVLNVYEKKVKNHALYKYPPKKFTIIFVPFHTV